MQVLSSCRKKRFPSIYLFSYITNLYCIYSNIHNPSKITQAQRHILSALSSSTRMYSFGLVPWTKDFIFTCFITLSKVKAIEGLFCRKIARKRIFSDFVVHLKTTWVIFCGDFGELYTSTLSWVNILIVFIYHIIKIN